MKVHHIGYLVKDIDAAYEAFSKLGYVMSEINTAIHLDEFRKIYILFIEKDGYCVELIAPYDKESSFYPLLKKYKNCAYHICYESDDREADVAKLVEDGWRQITPFDPATALASQDVGFFLHPKIGMIEIIDTKSGA